MVDEEAQQQMNRGAKLRTEIPLRQVNKRTAIEAQMVELQQPPKRVKVEESKSSPQQRHEQVQQLTAEPHLRKRRRRKTVELGLIDA